MNNPHRLRSRPRSVRDPHAHPVQPDPHAARPGLHGRGVLRRRAGAHLRAAVVLCRAVQRPDRAGVVPDRDRGPRERAAHPQPPGRGQAYFNVCRHRGARLCTEESGRSQRAFQCPYHAWTYDFDGKLIAAPNLTKMPDIDRVRVRPGHRPRPRVARLRVGLPRGRAAAVRVHRGRRGGRAARRPRVDRALRPRQPAGRPADRLRRQGQLEAHHRELHGVLPLRDDPPRAHRGPARVRRRLRGAVLRRTRRRVRRRRQGVHRRRLRGAGAAPGRQRRDRTAATTPSRSSRRSSSTWSPTT